MKCASCGSTRIKRRDTGEYYCEYCGTQCVISGGDFRNSKPDVRINPRMFAFSILLTVNLVFILFVLWFLNRPDEATHESGLHSTEIELSDAAEAEAKQTEFIKEAEAKKTLSGAVEYGADAIDTVHPPEAEFSNVHIIPDSIGNEYFVGYYTNTGKSPLRKPEVTVTLFDEAGKELASKKGYGIRDFLLPGEVVPVVILLTAVPEYSRYETSFEAKHPYSASNLVLPKITLQNVRMRTGDFGGRYVVSGRVVNNGKHSASYINFIAVLLDENKKIISYGTGYLEDSLLKPGESSSFSISSISVNGTPASFQLFYDGRVKD